MEGGARWDYRIEAEIDGDVVNIAEAERDHRHGEEIPYAEMIGGESDVETDPTSDRCDQPAKSAQNVLHQTERGAVADVDVVHTRLLGLAGREVAEEREQGIAAEAIDHYQEADVLDIERPARRGR